MSIYPKNMFNVLKQSVYASIGLANVTKEKVADLVAEVTKEGELTEQQVEEFKEEVSRRSEEARKELAALIDRQIDHAMIQMGIIKGEGRKIAEEAGNVLQTFVDQRVDEALQRIGVARSADVKELTQRIAALEKGNTS
jgi:polyhydroxyalkanoate synthesis regulator phasin